jgi:hypothetical protein
MGIRSVRAPEAIGGSPSASTINTLQEQPLLSVRFTAAAARIGIEWQFGSLRTTQPYPDRPRPTQRKGHG